MIVGLRSAIFALVAAGFAACATSVPHPNLGVYKTQLTGWHDSGDYDRAFAQAAKKGVTVLNNRIAHRHSGDRIAVVFDIDETLLSNWDYLQYRNFGLTAPSFADWVKAHNDPALTPTKEIFQTAQRAGIPIFLITGRSALLRADTIRQLRAAGFSAWTSLYMKPANYAQKSIVPFKSGARRTIAAQGYEIILNMGDQWSDLEGGFAKSTVKLPNPYYFIP